VRTGVEKATGQTHNPMWIARPSADRNLRTGFDAEVITKPIAGKLRHLFKGA
jgi:hypothetical protein